MPRKMISRYRYASWYMSSGVCMMCMMSGHRSAVNVVSTAAMMTVTTRLWYT